MGQPKTKVALHTTQTKPKTQHVTADIALDAEGSLLQIQIFSMTQKIK